jgi:hypothetical protein
VPRSTKRASQRDLDALHRLTVRALVAELRRVKRAKEPLPAALLNSAAKILALTSTTDPERPTKRADRLAPLLADFEGKASMDSDSKALTDFSRPAPAREFPEE